jgi:hypothetical protein
MRDLIGRAQVLDEGSNLSNKGAAIPGRAFGAIIDDRGRIVDKQCCGVASLH